MTRPHLLLLDNYDSFTWNLVQGLGAAGASVEVVRNDASTVGALCARQADGLVISPGPGTPQTSGLTLPLLRVWPRTVPLLGVCLGHQALGAIFGARVVAAPAVRHGKASPVQHDGTGVFAAVPAPCQVMRYHSLVLDPGTLPDALQVTARALDDGSIMAVRHRVFPFEGVQFHPESIGTPHGAAMLANFVAAVRARGQRSAA